MIEMKHSVSTIHKQNFRKILVYIFWFLINWILITLSKPLVYPWVRECKPALFKPHCSMNTHIPYLVPEGRGVEGWRKKKEQISVHIDLGGMFRKPSYRRARWPRWQAMAPASATTVAEACSGSTSSHGELTH